MFQPIALAEALGDFTPPTHLAPAPIKSALEAVSVAYAALMEANDNLDDAVMSTAEAETKYNQDGISAVREGLAELPDQSEIKRAAWTEQVAREKVAKARQALRLENGNLAGSLDNADNRKAWLLAIEQQAEANRKALLDQVNKISNLSASFSGLVDFSHWLGAWGHYLMPPATTDGNPASELLRLANVKTWQPAIALEQGTRWQQEIVENPKDSEEVFITSIGGSATHSVTRAHADRMLLEGHRLSTPEEIARWYEKQGLSQAALNRIRQTEPKK